MFQKFGATIVNEENLVQKPVAKVKAPKAKLATKAAATVVTPTDEEEGTHYECFRF